MEGNLMNVILNFVVSWAILYGVKYFIGFEAAVIVGLMIIIVQNATKR